MGTKVVCLLPSLQLVHLARISTVGWHCIVGVVAVLLNEENTAWARGDMHAAAVQTTVG